MMIVSSIILAMPAAAGLLGNVDDWSFCFDNILPYQTWFFHGCLIFVPLYMVLSGFYRPQWIDIFKAISVLAVTATFAQILNYTLEGSGADYMTLRYGNGNPFAFLLKDTPALYYIVVGAIAICGVSLLIAITIGITYLVEKFKEQKTTT